MSIPFLTPFYAPHPNKMQIVFGAPTGNAAKDAKLLFDTESRELHFSEIPHRPTSIRVR